MLDVAFVLVLELVFEFVALYFAGFRGRVFRCRVRRLRCDVVNTGTGESMLRRGKGNDSYGTVSYTHGVCDREKGRMSGIDRGATKVVSQTNAETGLAFT